MTEFFTESSVKATRKDHSCEGCNRKIDKGLPAKYYATKNDGDFYAGYYHVECRAAEIDWNSERDTWGEDFDCLWAMGDDDDAEAWFAWLRENHPIAADRLGVA